MLPWPTQHGQVGLSPHDTVETGHLADFCAVPRDARLISLMLASKGIQDADERVLQQLLDFAYRRLIECCHHSIVAQINAGYTADVLQSAQVLSDHASRPGPGKIEKDDIELALALRKRYEFFEAPPRDVRSSYSG